MLPDIGNHYKCQLAKVGRNAQNTPTVALFMDQKTSLPSKIVMEIFQKFPVDSEKDLSWWIYNQFLRFNWLPNSQISLVILKFPDLTDYDKSCKDLYQLKLTI